MLGAVIGGISGTLGGILGGVSRNKMLKEQMKLINEQKRQNDNWYDRRYNEAATQRADAQAALTRTAEHIRQRNQAATAAAAVTGATDISLAATKQANNQALADTAANIAAQGEARKDNIEQQYNTRRNQLNQQQANITSQRKSILDIAADAVGGAMTGYAAGSQLNNI